MIGLFVYFKVINKVCFLLKWLVSFPLYLETGLSGFVYRKRWQHKLKRTQIFENFQKCHWILMSLSLSWRMMNFFCGNNRSNTNYCWRNSRFSKFRNMKMKHRIFPLQPSAEILVHRICDRQTSRWNLQSLQVHGRESYLNVKANHSPSIR